MMGLPFQDVKIVLRKEINYAHWRQATQEATSRGKEA